MEQWWCVLGSKYMLWSNDGEYYILNRLMIYSKYNTKSDADEDYVINILSKVVLIIIIIEKYMKWSIDDEYYVLPSIHILYDRKIISVCGSDMLKFQEIPKRCGGGGVKTLWNLYFKIS